jgi:hypothetical protein
MGWIKSKPEEIEVTVQDKSLVCQICGYGGFWKRDAQLNTAGMSFMNLDWLNRTARCYVCARCGYVHWFLPT